VNSEASERLPYDARKSHTADVIAERNRTRLRKSIRTENAGHRGCATCCRAPRRMGWLDISVNVGTVMLASVPLGIVDDDTVHFINRFRHERAGGAGVDEALMAAAIFEGRAALTTTMVNSCGFAVLLLSPYRPTAWFGGLLALTMTVALLAEIFVLPATIKLLPRFFVTRREAEADRLPRHFVMGAGLSMPSPLRIPRKILDEMVFHAREANPFECCGLLAAQDGVVAAHYRIANAVAGDPQAVDLFEAAGGTRLQNLSQRKRAEVAYFMDPKQLLAAFTDMRLRGIELTAIYHSHPHSPAYPSPTDIALADYSECVYVIISLEDAAAPDVKAYWINDQQISRASFDVI
jgi:[CysO sulfur-carrier protein]-S-L-cysteine hydrolase